MKVVINGASCFNSYEGVSSVNAISLGFCYSIESKKIITRDTLISSYLILHKNDVGCCYSIEMYF